LLIAPEDWPMRPRPLTRSYRNNSLGWPESSCCDRSVRSRGRKFFKEGARRGPDIYLPKTPRIVEVLSNFDRFLVASGKGVELCLALWRSTL
jgi:hypothetical protein